MATMDEIEKAEENIKTLMDAAEMFGELLESTDSMVDEGGLPDDEGTEEMKEKMETAKEACELVSMSMTMALAQEGHIPDLDRDDEDDSDDDMPSRTFA